MKFYQFQGLIAQVYHTYSEAFYLQDLEGNGIEIYAHRPRDQWGDGPEEVPRLI